MSSKEMDANDRELMNIINRADRKADKVIGKIRFTKATGRVLISDGYKGVLFVREHQHLEYAAMHHTMKFYPKMLIIWEKTSI